MGSHRPRSTWRRSPRPRLPAGRARARSGLLPPASVSRGVRAESGWMRSRRVEVWEPQSDRFGVRAGRGRVPHVADVLARVSFGRRRLFGTEQAPVGLGGNGPAVASDKDIIAGTRSSSRKFFMDSLDP